MTTADTSRSELHYAEESTWATVPGSGTRKHLRFTGESLAVSRQTVQSDEIRADRQITDLVATRVDAQGSIEGEFSVGTYDSFIESAMFNEWEEVDTTNQTMFFNASKNLVLAANRGGKKFAVGQVILLSGFTNDENNGRFVITALVGTTSLTLKHIGGGDPVAEAATASDKVLKGSWIVNGTTQKSFYIEKFFDDVTQYITFHGMVVNQFTLTMESESLITVSMGFMGRRGKAQATSEIAGNIAAAPTGDIFNAGDNVGSILEADVGTLPAATAKTSPVTRLTFDLQNGLRQKPAVSQGEGIGIGAGRVNLTGSIATYFEDFDLYEKFNDNDALALRFSLEGSSGAQYHFYLPRIKLSEMTVNASGPDADVIAEGTYQALRDPTRTYTAIISKA